MALTGTFETSVGAPDCYCGLKGCIETWLCGPGLAADHRRVTGEALKAPEIVARAEAGDAAASATLARYEDRLARGLATLINTLDPEVIVLAGGVSNVKRLYALTFGLGAACVGAAGSMLVLLVDVTPALGPALTLLAFIIVITGGLGSMPGAVLGGVLIGLTEAMAGLFFTPSAKSMFSFALLVLVLLFRPQGILGKRPS